jgi:hypothetical protein
MLFLVGSLLAGAREERDWLGRKMGRLPCPQTTHHHHPSLYHHLLEINKCAPFFPLFNKERHGKPIGGI